MTTPDAAAVPEPTPYTEKERSLLLRAAAFKKYGITFLIASLLIYPVLIAFAHLVMDDPINLIGTIPEDPALRLTMWLFIIGTPMSLVLIKTGSIIAQHIMSNGSKTFAGRKADTTWNVIQTVMMAAVISYAMPLFSAVLTGFIQTIA